MKNRIAVVFPRKFSIERAKMAIQEFDPEFICDIFFWTDEMGSPKKVNKREMNSGLLSDLESYSVVMPVDSDVTKYLSNATGGISKFNAFPIDHNGKIYVPVINPLRVEIYPMMRKQVNAAFVMAYKAIHGEELISSKDKYYETIASTEDLISRLNTCIEKKVCFIDIETSALYPHEGYILGIALGWRDHMGIYAEMEFWNQEAFDLLRKICYDPEIMKVCHNISFEMKWLQYHLKIECMKWKNYHDTMFLKYCDDENTASDLKSLAVRFTDLGNYDAELDMEKKKLARMMKIKLADFSYAYIPTEILAPYACKDIDATAQVCKRFWFARKKYERAYGLLIECVPAIAELELIGGPISINSVQEGIAEYDKVIQDLQEELFTAPEVIALISKQGKEFNPNSHLQVRTLLYDIAGLPIIKRTDPSNPYSNPSTDREVLEYFEEEFPIAKKLVDYRKAVKFRNTYLMNLLTKTSSDNRIRTGFNMARTSSGRLSSSGNINFQNLPRGDAIKRMFSAREGYVIVQMDLGTAEVYIAAAESKDQFLIDAFASKLDFHGYMAKGAFGLDCGPDEVAKLYKSMRQAAKAITFGILYGAQAKKIAETIGCSKDEAQEHIDAYFKQASDLKKWIDDRKSFISQNAWIYSTFGRVRRVPEVFSPNIGVKFHAINSAFNFIIQSAASDYNMLGFSRLMAELKRDGHITNENILPFTIVHDSIVAEVKLEYVNYYCERIIQIFQTINKDLYPHMPTPIGLDFEVGPNWGNVKGIETVKDWRI